MEKEEDIWNGWTNEWMNEWMDKKAEERTNERSTLWYKRRVEWGKTPPLSYLTHNRSVFTGAGMYRCRWKIHLKLYKLASTAIDNFFIIYQ